MNVGHNLNRTPKPQRARGRVPKSGAQPIPARKRPGSHQYPHSHLVRGPRQGGDTRISAGEVVLRWGAPSTRDHSTAQFPAARRGIRAHAGNHDPPRKARQSPQQAGTRGPDGALEAHRHVAREGIGEGSGGRLRCRALVNERRQPEVILRVSRRRQTLPRRGNTLREETLFDGPALVPIQLRPLAPAVSRRVRSRSDS
jgi:hypothetical protein